MRILLIVVGIIVIALGIGATMGKFNYQHKSEVARVGGVSLSATQDKTVPEWAGIIGIVVGGALVLGGALKKG